MTATAASQVIDVRALPDDTRLRFAEMVHGSVDFALPRLRFWNYEPCRKHRPHGITQGCRECGIIPRRHQRIAIGWLYYARYGLLADTVGSGKTAVAAGVLAIMAETGELVADPVGREDEGRAVVICRAAAVPQWCRQLRRMIPGLEVISADGTANQRVEKYVSGGWHVLVTSYQTLLNDRRALTRMGITTVIVDDVDPLRHDETATARAVKALARNTFRTYVMSGTPLQKRLMELYSVLEPIGGPAAFGSVTTFRHRYVRTEKVRIYNQKTGRAIVKEVEVGTRFLDELKTKLGPLALRRTAADLDDVKLPAIIPSDVYLDLYPAQRARYTELRQGVLRRIQEEGTRLKQVTALTMIGYGQRICTGLPALGEADGPGQSCKLDWVTDKLQGDLADEKVVIFTAYTDTVAALEARLTAAGIGHVKLWGRDRDPKSRDAAMQALWTDPNCRVLIGTQTIEQSIDLQIARHLINIDMILNPARMEQLAGRIRRDGSAFSNVFVHNILTRDTQEERYVPLLEREQALIDSVWDEQSELFNSLTPLALLTMITG